MARSGIRNVKAMRRCCFYYSTAKLFYWTDKSSYFVF